MAYVEWLRVRRRLIVFTAILIVLTALIVLPVFFGHVHSGLHGGDVSIGTGSGRQGPPAPQALQEMTAQYRIPLSALLGIAAVVCMIFTTTLATSLNAQHAALNLAFTRPLSRERLALTYFSVDAVAIVVCFALSFLLVGCVPLLTLGLLQHVYFDNYAPLVAVLGIGTSIMFYGLLQGATAWARGSTALIVGIAWPIFLIAAIPGTPPFGGLVNAVLAVVRFLDPILYLRTAEAFVVLPPGFGAAPLVTAVLTVWTVGIAGCALAAFEWRRLEV